MTLDTEWRWRVVDQYGNELTPDLPHIISSYKVLAILRGTWPPTAQLGDAKITLVPPALWGTPEIAAAFPGTSDVGALNFALREMLRVECYDRAAGGAPLFSGLITQRPRATGKFDLSIQDSLFQLQKAKTERNDQMIAIAQVIIDQALKDWLPFYGDNFTSADLHLRYPAGTTVDGARVDYQRQPSSSYLQAGDLTSAWVSDGLLGLPVVSITNPPSAHYAHLLGSDGSGELEQKVDTRMRLYAAGGQKVAGGFVMGFGWSGSRLYRIMHEIDVSAGPGGLVKHRVFCLAASSVDDNGVLLFESPWTAGIILPDGSYTHDMQLSAWVNSVGIAVRENTQDLVGGYVILDGSTAALGLHSGDFAGAVGLTAWSSDGSGKVWARDLYQLTLAPQFTQEGGHLSTGTTVYQHNFNQTSRMEQLMIAAFAEDLDIHKDPVADVDQLSTIPLSATSVVFKEATYDGSGNQTDPGNIIVDTAVENPNVSRFATELAVQGQGGGQGPVIYTRSLDAIQKYGLWTRQENLVDIRDIGTLMQAGDVVTEMSSSPEEARELDVWDRPGVTKGLWREGSTAHFNVPTLGPDMTDQDRLIIGYERYEDSEKVHLILDNFPATQGLAEIQRIRSELDNLMGMSLKYIPPILQGGDTGTGPVTDPGPPGPPPDSGPPVPYPDLGGGGSGMDVDTGGGGGGTGGGGVTLIGGGPIPSGITLPVTYISGDRAVIVSVPFDVVDHPCNVLAFATLACEFASSEPFVKVQLHTGPDVSTVVNESQPTRMGSDLTLETGTALIAPPFTPLAIGSYVAWITLEPTGDGTLVDAIGEIQIYCV